MKLNATTSVCCNSTTSAGASAASAALAAPAVPVQAMAAVETCTRGGKPARFNLTTLTGTSISGTMLPCTTTLTAVACADSCCAAEGCVAFTWWADTPARRES